MVRVPKQRPESAEEDLVRLYLGDIGRHALLTKDDEARLAMAIEEGNTARTELQRAEDAGERLTPARKRELRAKIRSGEDATQTFIQANLRLVVSIAKKYQASELPLLDLVQEGNLGLIHAVEKFDYRKGFKSSTYATWWIRQAITRGIANSGRTIRLPVHAGDQLTRLRNGLDRGDARTLEEVGESFNLTRERIRQIEARAMSKLRHPSSDTGARDLLTG